MFNKFKGLLNHDIIFQSLLVVLVAVASFGLGRLSGSFDVSPTSTIAVTTESRAVLPAQVTTAAPPTKPVPAPAQGGPLYVGSRNGTKFHLLSCPGANSIKEENKVYFTSKQDAYSKGYTEAANCKGI